MIYTGYFAMIKKLPKDIIPISICVNTPSWYHGLAYKKLAPTYDILMTYKRDGNENLYERKYRENILDKLNPMDVCKELYDTAQTQIQTKDIILLCYEKSTDFCHRHLVSKWFRDNGIPAEEYNPSVRIMEEIRNEL